MGLAEGTPDWIVRQMSLEKQDRSGVTYDVEFVILTDHCHISSTECSTVAYSRQDVLQRIKATLPMRWFGESTPVLDSLLDCLSAGWHDLLNLLDYTRSQTRIASAFDTWLDMIARDYFGERLARRPLESDASLRFRIQAELLRDRCTRASVAQLLQDLTGRQAVIFEPTNPRDTGSYGSADSGTIGMAGYGASGGWGNLGYPFQSFVRVFRPVASGVASVNGWDGRIGGYGAGKSEYLDLQMDSSQPDNTEINESVCRIAPIGSIIWMTIEQ